MKKKISFEEFDNSIYTTQYHVRIPMLNIKLDKFDYFTDGKYDSKKVNEKIEELYKLNLNKLNGE